MATSTVLPRRDTAPPLLPNFPVSLGLEQGSTGGACRTLSPGTIWELVAPRWRPYGMDQVAIGAAIILAESGGRTCAVNVNTDGSRDRGPWQINSRAHPDVSDTCARNPVCASDAALQIYKAAGNSWSPWSTFNNGAYKKFEGDVTIKDANVEEQGFAQIDPLGSAMQFLEKLGVIFERDFWRRVGLILLGVVLAVFGLYFMGRPFIAGQIRQLVKG